MGSVQRAMQYASKYALLVSTINAIETGNITKIRELKRNTKLAMENLANQSCEASVLLYGGMNVYRVVMKMQRCPWFWWKFCRKKPKFTKHCQLFLRLLTGDRLHDRDNSRHICCLCDIDVQDKVSHYLFACTSLQEWRDTEWQHIANAMPPAMVIEIDEMDDAKRTTFLANGTYIQESNELYIQIVTFVKLMYIDIIKPMNDEE